MKYMDSYDLTIYQGSTFSVTRTLNDASGNALNLSGCAVSGYLKMRYGDSDSLAALDITVTQPLSGIVDIELSAQTTSLLPISLCPYDIEVFNSGDGTTYKPLGGLGRIYPEVTY